MPNFRFRIVYFDNSGIDRLTKVNDKNILNMTVYTKKKKKPIAIAGKVMYYISKKTIKLQAACFGGKI